MAKHLLFPTILLILAITCSPGNKGKGIEGIWEGKLFFPGFETRIIFKLTLLADGNFEAVMLKPDEHDEEISAIVLLENSSVSFKVEKVNGLFIGQLDKEKNKITGQWTQGNISKPVTLYRVTEIVIQKRPQTPSLPYPYDEKIVTFTNRDGGAVLAGTLTLPREGDNVPAVVLIAGGGAHDRDYTIFRHKPFLVIADHLTRNGIAILRFDERGVGASTGDRSKATSENFAHDVLAGVDFLRTINTINPNKIGLIGHSEGGSIASIAASKSKDIAFIVMMGSPGLPGEQYHYQYEETTGRALGLSEEEITAKRDLQERVFAVLKNEKNYDKAKAKLSEIFAQVNPNMPEDQKNAGINRFLSPWFRYSLDFVPAVTLRSLQCPVLVLFAEKDLHVPPEGNVEAIRRALEESGNTDYKVEILAGLNHFFQTSMDDVPFQYGRISETISPNVLMLISDWIRAHTTE